MITAKEMRNHVNQVIRKQLIRAAKKHQYSVFLESNLVNDNTKKELKSKGYKIEKLYGVNDVLVSWNTEKSKNEEEQLNADNSVIPFPAYLRKKAKINLNEKQEKEFEQILEIIEENKGQSFCKIGNLCNINKGGGYRSDNPVVFAVMDRLEGLGFSCEFVDPSFGGDMFKAPYLIVRW